MFIPVSTDRPRRHDPVVTIALIVLTLVAYGATSVLTIQAEDGSIPEIVKKFGLMWRPAEPWRFISYLFLHADIWHVAGNLLFLWVFGPSVEDRFGKAGFLGFYLAGGVLAGLAHVATTADPVIGASGAISAVTGAYLVLFPRTTVKVLIIFIMIGIWNIPAMWFIGFALFRDLLSQAVGAGSGISHAAHLGGYAWGMGLSALLLGTGILKREEYDMIALWKHGARRRELRRVVREAEEERTLVAQGRSAPESRKKNGRAAAPAIPDEAAVLRAEVTKRVSERDLDGAIGVYRTLGEKFAAIPGAATLGRRTHLDLSNAMFERGEHALAAAAYQRFLDSFPTDAEAARVRLMLSLLLVRYLREPGRAIPLLRKARESVQDTEQIALADSLLAEAAGAGGAAA